MRGTESGKGIPGKGGRGGRREQSRGRLRQEEDEEAKRKGNTIHWEEEGVYGQ